jgi:hypothetical protein
LEKVVFERFAKRAFKWRPQAGAIEVVEEQFLLDQTIEGAGEAEYASEEGLNG